MRKQLMQIFAGAVAYSMICAILISFCLGLTVSFAREEVSTESEDIISIEEIQSSPYDFYHNINASDILNINQVTRCETTENSPVEVDTVKEDYISLSQDEIDLISKIVYLEGRGETYECQQGIVSVIINRMTTENKNAHEVIFAENQFTTAKFVDKGEVTEDIQSIVIDIAANGPTIPVWVTYFRAKKYHQWDNEYGTVIPYDKIDHTYFSYDKKLYDEYCD